MSDAMRLQKYLSRAGVASRRESETLILQGRVRLNGERVVELGTKVTPGADQVELDGKVVELVATRWILLHKPRGVLTTRDDPGGRPTVYGLLPEDARELRYVGRLDRNTEGLLVFTNAGDALHALTHPSSRVPRRYLARVVGVPDDAVLRRLEGGIELEDGPARFEDVSLVRTLSPESALLALTLREGRKREVRRALEAVGHPVRGLRRTAFGPLRLGDLPQGSWRDLTPQEVAALRQAAGMPRPPSAGRSGKSGRAGGSGGSGKTGGSGRKR